MKDCYAELKELIEKYGQARVVDVINDLMKERGEKVKQNKTTPNVKVTPEHIEIIKDLAEQTGNKYSDMFRMILTLGIENFKSQMSNI